MKHLKWHITTQYAEQTEAVGEQLGSRVRGGEVIELISDLGGGKTTFVRGLARGMGSQQRVASPTFTIAREYAAGEHTLHHFDFYRLHEPGVIAAELAELMADSRAVVVIEWSDIVRHVLPARRFTITITPTSETGRKLDITAPDTLSYLMSEQSVL